MRFFGGFWAFPGGKVDATDADLTERLAIPNGWTDDHAVRCIAVVRELFEETGVLLARRPDGTFPKTVEIARFRQPMIDEELSFLSILDELNLRIRGSDFALIGDITTPAFTSLRFETTFFVGHLPEDQDATLIEGELVNLRWTTAADTLADWTKGNCFLSPPTVMTLEAINNHPVDDAPYLIAPSYKSYKQGAIHPIYFAPYVQLIPLRTRALPPSDHTNAFLVGRDPAYLIDPGPDSPEEQAKLFTLLDERIHDGIKVRAIILTHQHFDHLDAANACRDRYGLPIWAHPITAEQIKKDIVTDRYINDSDQLELGQCPNGGGLWSLEAIHTPGHAPGHLAFYDPQYKLMFAADMVSPQTSMIIAPPDGDVQVYLDSLHKLQTYDMRLLLPSHGMPTRNPTRLIEQAIKHRAKREKLLLEALTHEPQSIKDMVPELYKGIAEQLIHLAELQTLAGLIKLRNEGIVEEVNEQWRLISQDGKECK